MGTGRKGAVLQIIALWGWLAGAFNGTGLPEYVIFNGTSQYAVNNATLLAVYQIANILAGLLMGLATVLLLLGKERRALRIGTFALIISLTIVNLLTFYYSQLYAVGVALAQLVLLIGAVLYRWRFFINK